VKRERRQGIITDDERGGEGGFPGLAATAKKEVELYFHRMPPPSGATSPALRGALRFVMLETRNPLIRAEGAWRISAGSVSREER
jgi:hypothetical protein